MHGGFGSGHFVALYTTYMYVLLVKVSPLYSYWLSSFTMYHTPHLMNVKVECILESSGRRSVGRNVSQATSTVFNSST